MLKYTTPKGDISLYEFDIVDKTNCSYILNGIKQDFRYIISAHFLLNNKEYTVFKYESGYRAIDGSVSHFWTPEFGLFFSMSNTWCNYSKLLITSNKEKQKELSHLIEMVLLNYDLIYGYKNRTI